jgi:hypothetical protein
MSNANPSDPRRLRLVTKRIAELQAEQRELIASIGLNEDDESVIISTLELANEIEVFLDRVKGAPNVKQRRRGVTLTRKLERANARLERLPETDASAAARAAAEEAGDRLLARMFNA